MAWKRPACCGYTEQHQAGYYGLRVVTQRSCPWVPGSVQDQAGWDLEQSGIVEDVPAHGRGWHWMGFKVPPIPNNSIILCSQGSSAPAGLSEGQDGDRGLSLALASPAPAQGLCPWVSIPPTAPPGTCFAADFKAAFSLSERMIKASLP